MMQHIIHDVIEKTSLRVTAGVFFFGKYVVDIS